MNSKKIEKRKGYSESVDYTWANSPQPSEKEKLMLETRLGRIMLGEERIHQIRSWEALFEELDHIVGEWTQSED